MTDTRFGLDVMLGTAAAGFTSLRIAVDEKGVPQYEEEDVSGAEVVNPADGQHFADVFNTWHKGGFIKEHVQDGYYYRSRNVDCTTPGEIKPGPRRIVQMTFAPGAGLETYGVSGLAFDPDINELLVVVKYENAVGDNVPNALRSYWVTASHAQNAGAATNNAVLDTTAADRAGITGMTNKTPILEFLRSGVREFIVPIGDQFRPLTWGALGTLTDLPCHAMVWSNGRLFKLSIQGQGFIQISNCDAAAIYTNVGNWTANVVLPITDGLLLNATGISLMTLDGVPVFGTARGLWALGPGGNPYNLLPQMRSLPLGHGNLSSLTTVSGGIAGGMYGPGHLLWTNGRNAVRIGPGTSLLAKIDNTAVMHIEEAPNGNLWVLVWYMDRTSVPPEGPSPEGTWEMWVGIRQVGSQVGPDSYAWHAVITDDSTDEDGAGNATWRVSNHRPFLPIYFNAGDSTTRTPEIAIGTTGGVNASRLLFVSGHLFFDETEADDQKAGVYENHSIAYGANVIVQWRSGRYSRHDPRVSRHWTRMRFKGKNIGAAAAAGGRIRVEVSYDGGVFADPPGGAAVYLTSNDQSVNIDTSAYDIEVRLTWQLDGVDAATMGRTPATITQIILEGREVPNILQRITMLVDPDHPAQAGGVRSKRGSVGIRDRLNDNLSTVQQTFRDPFRINRTVSVLRMKKLSATNCRRMKVSEGMLQIILLAAP